MASVNIALRDFRPGDFETLWRIDQECFAAGIAYSRFELGSYMRRGSSFTRLAEDVATGETVGFIVGEVARGAIGHIITIDVLPKARRARVGSKLLTAAEDSLRLAGCRGVRLETAVDNRAALAFYKRQGYFLVNTVPRYYANGVDALVLEKSLASDQKQAAESAR